MADAPDWPKILSLAVHELRTPLTVACGYLRMLSSNRVGPITDAQRRVIEEAGRSCDRLSTVLSEISEVARFDQDQSRFLRGPVDLARVLQSIDLASDGEPLPRLVVGAGVDNVTVNGDAARLGKALSAIAAGVAREMSASDELHVLPIVRDATEGREAFIAFGSSGLAQEILAASPASLSVFDASRGGNGLRLIAARQVLQAHGARLYGGPSGLARLGAGIALPLSS